MARTDIVAFHPVRDGLFDTLGLGRHVGIEHAEARVVYVAIQYVGIFPTNKPLVDRAGFVWGGPRWVDGRWSGIEWDEEHVASQKLVCRGVDG